MRIFDGDSGILFDNFNAYEGGFVCGASVGGEGKPSAENLHVQYEWDHHNQLTRVEFHDINNVVTKAVAFAYDPFGRRIAKRTMVDNNGNRVLSRMPHVALAIW